MRTLTFALLAAAIAHAQDQEPKPHRARELLAGVREIGVPGVPGLLSVYGDDAFPVLAAPTRG